MTNRLTGEQAWFNDARTRKPQTFKTAAAPSLQSPMFRAEEATAGSPPAHHAHDPTEGGRNCDFCKWQQLTAQVGAVPKRDQRQFLKRIRGTGGVRAVGPPRGSS